MSTAFPMDPMGLVRALAACATPAEVAEENEALGYDTSSDRAEDDSDTLAHFIAEARAIVGKADTRVPA
jgi:hypothetical protein